MTKGIKVLAKALQKAAANAHRMRERTDDVFTMFATYSAVIGIQMGESDEQLVELFTQLLKRARVDMGVKTV